MSAALVTGTAPGTWGTVDGLEVVGVTRRLKSMAVVSVVVLVYQKAASAPFLNEADWLLQLLQTAVVVAATFGTVLVLHFVACSVVRGVRSRAEGCVRVCSALGRTVTVVVAVVVAVVVTAVVTVVFVFVFGFVVVVFACVVVAVTGSEFAGVVVAVYVFSLVVVEQHIDFHH